MFTKMWSLIFIITCGFKHSLGCRSYEEIPDKKDDKGGKTYFSNGSSWGGWNPPEGDDSWKLWIARWGKMNNSKFDSTEEGRGPDSGWPTHWKGLGKANAGVPPPPWAYVPLSYGKPQFCFLLPAKGNCNESLVRWGFNPTVNECQKFMYSGCGSNQNNFMNKEDCKAACVDVPSTNCDVQEKINFEELIFE